MVLIKIKTNLWRRWEVIKEIFFGISIITSMINTMHTIIIVKYK